MDYIPNLAKDLIEQLDKEMPRPMYSTLMNMNEFMMRTGERRLIETLLIKLKRTEEEG